MGRGVRMRAMLLASLIVVIVGTTTASLLIVRTRMRQQVTANLADDLSRSVKTFQNIEAQRLTALQRENALLADLPNLKALMTTNDQRTIEDDAIEFWRLSGNDLFALADNDGHIVAAYTKGTAATEDLSRDLESLISTPAKHYLLSGGRLFESSVRPLYFGSEKDGTLLGYVVSGYAIDQNFLREVGQGAGAEATFVASGKVVASTLPLDKRNSLQQDVTLTQHTENTSLLVVVGGERYSATTQDLSAQTAVPLRLVVMKSFDQAERAEREINRLVSIVSLMALLIGAILMLVLSHMVTRPLELLALSVRAFGTGDTTHSLPEYGTLEVRELSRIFARMRSEIQETNKALLESERLATIGRMASSVSHDLRHYLAAVYANAEFLSSSRLTAEERIELFGDIQIAVHGTTDLIDSLLTFSRTGNAEQRSSVSIVVLVERAIVLVRTHPDADGVTILLDSAGIPAPILQLDAKQIERALYNLLLNACQSTRSNTGRREILVTFAKSPDHMSVTITDNGPGIAESIRNSLFEPFVSEGKQKGTGLGLTLAQRVAQEHGGDVTLICSDSGMTTFRMTVSCKPVKVASVVTEDHSKMISG
jgi:signal transduction histidine kinase